jgi:uncharacterized protein YigE (DUF2233 family)
VILVALLGCRRSHGDPPAPVATWRQPALLAVGVTAREGRMREWRLVDVTIDPARVELRVVGLGSAQTLDQVLPPGAVAATNGGYFDEKMKPVGWLVDHATELAPRARRQSGGVVALRGASAWIGPAAKLGFAPEFAVQNSPRLVEDDGKIGIRTDDGKRAARTIACTAGDKLHLMVALAWSGEGPTLLETAKLVAADPAQGGLGCRAALNLDGGPSTGVWLPERSGIATSLPRAPIAYGIAVVPRSAAAH